MSEERFEHVRTICAAALAAPAADRARVIEDACSGDETLRREVESALRTAEQATLAGATSTVGSAPVAPTADVNGSRATPSGGPGRIGSYTVLERLGEGGMGLVYLARQDRTERTVALKVIRPGVGSSAMLRRFELEGRTLARLQHPGIAQIFDAGVVRQADGAEQPYVALEHVRGVDLRSHADGRSLGTRERIELVIAVCEAVQHAHNKGVIHRDLKPGNILIDSTGRPKVLDFGVARLTEQDADHPMATQAGQIVGTVPYMSPEQIAGDPEAVDTRTDVYALGVVLYELLTGRLPHDVTGKTIVEAARVIESQSPEPIGRVRPELRGDLQTIVATALHKDRALRYQSPSALGEDLRRSLNNEPIQARAASTLYTLGKFVRRNRPLVGLGVAAVLLLAAGVAGTVWQAVRATRGWERASQENAAATAANELLVRTIESADPEHNLGAALTVKQVLDQMSALAGTELAAQERVEWSVRGTLSRTYRSLDELEQAERNARRAQELSRSVFGDESIEAIRSERELGMILAQGGKFDEAEAIARRGVGLIASRFGESHPDYSIAKSELARVLQETGRWVEAEPLLREAVEIGLRNRGEADPEVLVSMHNLATALKDQGRLEEGEALLRRVLDLRIEIHGERHPQTAFSINNLAAAVQKQGRNEEALELFRRALTIREALLGPDHQSTLTTRLNMAVCLISLGRPAEAEPHVRAALDGYQVSLGEGHAKTLIAMGNLAYLLEELGKIDQAEQVYRRVVDLRKSTQGGKDPETWSAINNLAMLLQTQGKPAEAEPLLRELVEACEQTLPAGHYYTAIFANNHADVLVDLGRFDEAEPLLRDSLTVIMSTLGENHARAEKGRARLARMERLRDERRSTGR